MINQLVHDISTDGVTVWVNGAYGCIGRFGRAGIDIHQEPNQQQLKGQCLFCTHEPTDEDDWPLFVAKMKEFFGIEVSDEYKPKRFRTASAC